jgi:rhodanese-related sulfurtransferase
MTSISRRTTISTGAAAFAALSVLQSRAARTAEDQATVKEMLAAAKAEVPAISPGDAAKLLGKDNVLFLDVRDAPELAASGKVKGALNVSRGFLEFKADPASPMYDKAFDGEKQIVLYCASGGRAALAGQTLKAMGYKNVYNLGAFKDWKSAGGAVE